MNARHAFEKLIDALAAIAKGRQPTRSQLALLHGFVEGYITGEGYPSARDVYPGKPKLTAAYNEGILAAQVPWAAFEAGEIVAPPDEPDIEWDSDTIQEVATTLHYRRVI